MPRPTGRTATCSLCGQKIHEAVEAAVGFYPGGQPRYTVWMGDQWWLCESSTEELGEHLPATQHDAVV
jgi:hypothetical protein